MKNTGGILSQNHLQGLTQKRYWENVVRGRKNKEWNHRKVRVLNHGKNVAPWAPKKEWGRGGEARVDY